jgi:hypothetical protein
VRPEELEVIGHIDGDFSRFGYTFEPEQVARILKQLGQS